MRFDPDQVAGFEKIPKHQKRGNQREGSLRFGRPERCSGKRSYRKEREAEDAIQMLYKSGRATYLRVYRCTKCFRWHLTHLKPRRYQ